jgi:hypothetical protein
VQLRPVGGAGAGVSWPSVTTSIRDEHEDHDDREARLGEAFVVVVSFAIIVIDSAA